ncbi:MAG: thioredoxin domain-containing protein, partial [Planctomycetota bacterium]|nr:thioredoxin domain-containing protein [Planctomycetota bacterium]
MTLSRILFGLLVLLTPAMVTAEELIPWMDDLDQAFSKAEQENKLVLIHFWHEQCAPCRKLESFVFKDGKIAAAIDRDYVAVKVNTRKNPALAKRYKIKSVPQDLVYRSDGEILSQRISPSNSRGYMFMLSQTVKSARGKQGGVDVAVVRAVNGNDPSGIPVVQGQSQFTPPSGPKGFRSGHRLSDQSVDQIDPSAQAGPANQSSLPAVSVPSQVVDNPFVGEQGAQNVPVNTSFDPSKIKNVNTVAIVNYDQNAETTTVRQAEVRDEGDPQPAVVEPDSPTSDTTVESAQPGQTESPSGDAAQTQEALGPDSPEASLPPLGLEGFCPIALIENKEWKEGDRQFGCIHRG